MLTKQDLESLAAQLPPLKFDPSKDCRTKLSNLEQAYLKDYKIDFTAVPHAFGVVSSGGFRVATHYWLPENARGTLLVMHGYYDHQGVFGHAIRYGLEHQLAVLAFDLPGHGLSSGEPAAIDSFDQYADVLAHILQQTDNILPRPLHVIGQSTGAAVVLNYLWRYRQHSLATFDRIALCCPLVVPRGWRGWYLGRYVYAVLRPFVARIKRTPSHSSHDLAFNQFINQVDPLQAKHLPLSWVGAMKAWYAFFVKQPPLEKSLLIVQGTGDMTVDWRYNVPLIKSKLPNATLVTVEGAGHQLVNESDEYRAQVFAAIDHYFFHQT